MAGEEQAEQVERLALVPIGGGPQVADRGRLDAVAGDVGHLATTARRLHLVGLQRQREVVVPVDAGEEVEAREARCRRGSRPRRASGGRDTCVERAVGLGPLLEQAGADGGREQRRASAWRSAGSASGCRRSAPASRVRLGVSSRAAALIGRASVVRPGLFSPDDPLQLQDAVDQRLRPRRAPRHVHVDRHDLVDALHHAVAVVVVELNRRWRSCPWRSPSGARPSGGRRARPCPPPCTSPCPTRSAGPTGGATPAASRRTGRGRRARRWSPSSRWRSRPARTSSATASGCGPSR